MRVMGIDYGDERIGLAVSDPTGTLVGDAWTLKEWDMDRAAVEIAGEAEARHVERLVLGLPRNMDGTEGLDARKPADSRKNLKKLPDCRFFSGMSAEVLWRRTRFFMPTERRSGSTALQWMP